MAFVVRLLVQNVIFGAIKFVSKRFSHVRNSISELIDNGIEKRYCGRKALSAFDRPPIAFDRMCWTLAGGYQHAFSHDETQPHEVFTGLCEFLMQIRHHADNLVAQDIEAQVPVRARKDFACEIRDWGASRDPVTATRVGQPEVQPDPAGAVLGDMASILSCGIGSAAPSALKRYAQTMPMAGVASAKSRVSMAVSSLANHEASGTGAHDNTMTALLRSLLRGVDEAAGLTPPQRGVVPVTAQQFVMRTLFHDAAVIEHHKPVHLRNGR